MIFFTSYDVTECVGKVLSFQGPDEEGGSHMSRKKGQGDEHIPGLITHQWIMIYQIRD